MLLGPGAGTGDTGIWKVGVWVEATVYEGAFATTAEALFGMSGILMLEGNFAVDGDAETAFAGGIQYEGEFAAEAEATLDFMSLGFSWGVFQLDGEATTTFAAAASGNGAFAIVGEAEYHSVHFQFMYGLMQIQADAQMRWWRGRFNAPGAFAMTAEASGSFHASEFPWGVFAVKADGQMRWWRGEFVPAGEFALQADGGVFFHYHSLGHGTFHGEADADTRLIGIGGVEGAFALRGEASLVTLGFDRDLGYYAVEATADISFGGHVQYVGGLVPMVAEGNVRSFGIKGRHYQWFHAEAEAEVEGFEGEYTPPDQYGAFAVAGIATLRMFWSPDISPGTGQVCAPEDPADAAGQPDPADAGCQPEPSEATAGGTPDGDFMGGVPSATDDIEAAEAIVEDDAPEANVDTGKKVC